MRSCSQDLFAGRCPVDEQEGRWPSPVAMPLEAKVGVSGDWMSLTTLPISTSTPIG